MQDCNKGKQKKHQLSWRLWHKWAGILFAFFILMFCFSGIVLNHRRAFSSIDVSRSWLPDGYEIRSWNQGVIKGTLPYTFADGKRMLIVYGQTGVWLTDSLLQGWSDFNKGIKDGVDNRKIANVVTTGDSSLWCTGLYDVYRYDAVKRRWQTVEIPDNDERVTDVTVRGKDTIAVLTRSKVYIATAPHYTFRDITLQAPTDYNNKVSLFRMVWLLHSGELFGLTGQLVVDIIAVVLIILCVTGIAFFILRHTIRHSKNKKRQGGWMRWNLKWHNKIGVYSIVLTMLLAITGWCLRPPLMIPLAMTRVSPIPGTTQGGDNVFHDKLRAIRWNASTQSWLLCTSEGFYSIGEDIATAVPQHIEGAPSISPMGINVFCQNPAAEDEWLVGSFSGLVSWNPATGEQTDWFTGKVPQQASRGKSIDGHAVTGWTNDLTCTDGIPVVFEYMGVPNVSLPEMPEVLKSQPISLWNLALEIHTGRCYPFMTAMASMLFIFISGLVLTLILWSGYRIRN